MPCGEIGAACAIPIGRAVNRTAAGKIAERIRLIGRHLLVFNAQGERRSVALVREHANKQTRMNGCSRAVVWCAAHAGSRDQQACAPGARMARSVGTYSAVTSRILKMDAFCG